MMRKAFLIFGFVMLTLTAWAQLRNPVIQGFHPTPSVCRVGDDFYLVNSSFCYFPGVPVYHSKDLVNWELIGNALDRESQLPLRGAFSWIGIFAPTIRYHEGTYYIVSTNVGNGGNFLITAKDPRGPWSEPVWLEQLGIDPSLWFEDGKCYMVSNPNDIITLCEIDPVTGKQLSPGKPVWQGMGMRYPEAPHIYKKDGWYYLLLSEGGTEIAHCMTIARSKNIYGPYVANPANPILTNCNVKGQNSQIQAVGHGDFVQAKDGSWWTVFLGQRHYGGSYHHLGRETCLAPMEWKTGLWPVINGGNPIDTLMQVKTLPEVKMPQLPTDYKFNKPLGPEWVYIQNPDSTKYRMIYDKLRLYGSVSTLTGNDRPTFVGRRQEGPGLLMQTHVDFRESYQGDEAGLCIYQIFNGHAEICLEGTREKMQVSFRATLKDLSGKFAQAEIDGYEAWLRVRSDGNQYFFEYSTDGEVFRSLFKISCTLLSNEAVGGFTGVVCGMYCTKKNETDLTYANFDAFKFKNW